MVRIETRGGVEYGACTEEGVLFLGRTASEGPCRVHFFLGPRATPIVDDGTIHHLGGVYYRAVIDLKTPAVPVLEREPTAADTLVAMVHAGREVHRVPVRLAQRDDVSGDVLEWPGESLPAGTAILAQLTETLRFVGLVAGEATVQRGETSERFLVFTGTDRVREALAAARPHPSLPEVIHRPDDITVTR